MGAVQVKKVSRAGFLEQMLAEHAARYAAYVQAQQLVGAGLESERIAARLFLLGGKPDVLARKEVELRGGWQAKGYLDDVVR